MLDHIILTVSNFTEAVAFYEAVLRHLHYDPRYYASQVVDLDGYTLEFVYKSWQH